MEVGGVAQHRAGRAPPDSFSARAATAVAEEGLEANGGGDGGEGLAASRPGG